MLRATAGSRRPSALAAAASLHRAWDAHPAPTLKPGLTPTPTPTPTPPLSQIDRPSPSGRHNCHTSATAVRAGGGLGRDGLGGGILGGWQSWAWRPRRPAGGPAAAPAPGRHRHFGTGPRLCAGQLPADFFGVSGVLGVAARGDDSRLVATLLAEGCTAAAPAAVDGETLADVVTAIPRWYRNGELEPRTLEAIVVGHSPPPPGSRPLMIRIRSIPSMLRDAPCHFLHFGPPLAQSHNFT